MPRPHPIAIITNRLFLMAILLASSSIGPALWSAAGKGEIGIPPDRAVLPQAGSLEGAYLKSESARPRAEFSKPLSFPISLVDDHHATRLCVLVASDIDIFHVSPLIISQTFASEF